MSLCQDTLWERSCVRMVSASTRSSPPECYTLVTHTVTIIWIWSADANPLCSQCFVSPALLLLFIPPFPTLPPPLHLLYHGCINSCVTVEPERGKGSRFEVAAAITGWAACGWIITKQLLHYIPTVCCLSGPKLLTGEERTQPPEVHTHKHVYKCTLTHLNPPEPQRLHIFITCNFNSHSRQQ